MTDGSPLKVSLIVPCRDEKNFISACLSSILANDYSGEYEVIVADGMSTDGTRDIVSGLCRADSRVRLIDNPAGTTPCAMNAGIRSAKGGIIMKMDAHSVYDRSYISLCVRYLDEYKADNVGGVLTPAFLVPGFVTRAIKGVISSPFGVGNSLFRTGAREPSWVDTVAFGCYRKDVFSRIGLYNERLTRGQDMELNIRLRKAGGKILLHPAIKGSYYPPHTIGSFLSHSFRNGVWAVVPFGCSDVVPVSVRHLVPLFFCCSIIAALGAAVAGIVFPLEAIVAAYCAAALWFSAICSGRQRDLRLFPAMPALFFFFHLSYGLGSLFGMLKSLGNARFRKNFFSAKFQ